jgi:hypothetical protein
MKDFLQQHIELSAQEYADFIGAAKKRILEKGEIFLSRKMFSTRYFQLPDAFGYLQIRRLRRTRKFKRT